MGGKPGRCGVVEVRLLSDMTLLVANARPSVKFRLRPDDTLKLPKIYLPLQCRYQAYMFYCITTIQIRHKFYKKQ
jgi:hypothetical protein